MVSKNTSLLCVAYTRAKFDALNKAYWKIIGLGQKCFCCKTVLKAFFKM